MKIQSNIHAGAMTLQQCQAQRDYWKAQATKMEAIANGPGPYYPPNPYPPNPYPPQPTPQPPTPGGGWVNGIWYSDQSGLCG